MPFLKYDEAILDRYNTDLVFNVAVELVQRWGLVTVNDYNEEDTAGRHHFTIETPTALVQRAFEIARLFVQEAEAGGHIKDLGPVEAREFILQSFDGWKLARVTGHIAEQEKRRKIEERHARAIAEMKKEDEEKTRRTEQEKP